MAVEDLVCQVRKALSKPKGYRVFYASGLNEKDVQLLWSQLSEEEKAVALKLYNETFEEKINPGEEADVERLLAMCNALFDTSSNVSSIANVYGDAEEVLAILHSNPIKETDLVVKGGRTDDISVELANGNVKNEANVISRGTYWVKNRKDGLYGQNSRNSYSALEYLSLVVVDGSGTSNKFLASNLPILANYSYIVGKDGYVVRQKYGETNRFIDVAGKDHRSDL